MIDIAKQIENYKGSLMYAATTWTSDKDQQVEIRLGTPNSWKLWVNGELVFEREEYHRSSKLDQYRVPVTLKVGREHVDVQGLSERNDTGLGAALSVSDSYLRQHGFCNSAFEQHRATAKPVQEFDNEDRSIILSDPGRSFCFSGNRLLTGDSFAATLQILSPPGNRFRRS